ncbi:hypothetical protein PZA11_004393 [Diplocarpon coronariae]
MRFSTFAALTTLLVGPVLSAPTESTPKRDYDFDPAPEKDDDGSGVDANVGLGLHLGLGLGLEADLGLDADVDVDADVEVSADLGLDIELELAAEVELTAEVDLEVEVKLEVNINLGINLELDLDVEHYATPTEGWDGLMYPTGPGKGSKMSGHGFTSTYTVIASGSEVLNGTKSAPGPADARGIFYYVINSEIDTICWKTMLFNVVGDYMSPALTATHIHEAARGKSGPPRIAFPNPVGDDKVRISKGCMTGPFKTGVKVKGEDTGAGFKLSQIEANPAGFFTDSHTKLYPLGVVRGQIA